MNITHEQAVFIVGFSVMVGFCAIVFIAWLMWSLCWEIYDHFMEQHMRQRNAEFDARVGRDCYRDTKGITR